MEQEQDEYTHSSCLSLSPQSRLSGSRLPRWAWLWSVVRRESLLSAPCSFHVRARALILGLPSFSVKCSLFLLSVQKLPTAFQVVGESLVTLVPYERRSQSPYLENYGESQRERERDRERGRGSEMERGRERGNMRERE